MQDRKVAETRAIRPELTAGALSMCKLAEGLSAEAGKGQGQHRSHKAELLKRKQ